MTEDDTPTAVKVSLTIDTLPHAIRTLLGYWREQVQAKWESDKSLPPRELVRLHTIAHAAAVATFLEDKELTTKIHGAEETYFNDPTVVKRARQDDTWFYTRVRAVDALLDSLAKDLQSATAAGRLTLDAPDVLLQVATELVDALVATLSSEIELSLEILAQLPPTFADPTHRANATSRAQASLISKLGEGEPIDAVPVLESIFRGLGHPAATNLTSAARKR